MNLRRINSELHEILNIYSKVICEKENDNIIFNFKVDDFNIFFKMKNDYPFKPPITKINNYDYITLIGNTNSHYLNEIKGTKGICLCCISLLCSNNWCPVIKLLDIINEIKYNLNIKKNIVKRILIDKVTDKYLNRDISIKIKMFL